MVEDDDSHDVELELELEEIFVRFRGEIPDAFTASYIGDNVWQEPALAVSDLLRLDAHGITPMPDDVVARLWTLGHALGCSNEFLLSTESMAKARPERRTRPPEPPPPPLRGGGHGPGRRGAGKRVFPSSWSDDETIARTMDVARHPSGAVELPSGDFRAEGERGRVLLAVLVSPEGDVLTSYPVRGDGVVQNPLSPEQEPLVQRLRALVEQVPPGAARDALEELLDVGEWPHVLASLRALGADPHELDALAAYVS